MDQQDLDVDPNTPKQIVQEVSGFTPLFDAVVEYYEDETRAAVHGAMWRYCQMGDGVCRASMRTIAKRVGVDVATASRHTDALVEDGYFIDTTPGLRNTPHIYADTGKVVMRSSLFAGVAQRNRSVAENNSGVAQRNKSVAESRLKKERVSKKDSKSGADKPATPKATDFPSNILFREVTGRYPARANWQTVQNRVAAVEKRLGHTPTKDELFPFYEAWCGNGWNTQSINWLEYAERGVLPTMNGAKSKQQYATPAPVNQSQYELALQQAQSLLGAS